jgi:glutaminyl-tRNA synthetase
MMAMTDPNSTPEKPSETAPETPVNFIHAIIDQDLQSGRFSKPIVTRFPPEPNGYLHIGHAKSICLNFGLAAKYGGRCHLRFDDTNPTKEDQEYIDSIKRDVKWLGFDWGDHEYYASDYFEKLYEFAIKLIKAGKAYVDDLTGDEIRQYRGTLNAPGKESPYRNRSVEENLDLFERMRKGEFSNGSRTLRAKIDMASRNLNLRDPVMYRILHAHHHRTGDKWCIYPMYDFAHGQSDAIENITHSICTLEFEDHRPLYDWFIENLELHHPRQVEFARLNVTYMLMSKRKLLTLVEEKIVEGWDDPRMPTLSGLRRRGYSPEALRLFCERIGVTKFNGMTEIQLLEHCLREDLNKRALRVMAVLNPLKVVIENYPEGQVEWLDAVNNPEDPSAGTRKVPFSRELYIEQDDFMEDPPKKFFRLSPGKEVRLRYGYFITCKEVIKDDKGNIVELRCTYDPATRGGDAPDGRKVKATLHWVSATESVPAKVRLYDQLFTEPEAGSPPPGKPDGDWRETLNPHSLTVVTGHVEPSVKTAKAGEYYQFERVGYFCIDEKDSSPAALVFNRTVGLKDSFAKVIQKG